MNEATFKIFGAVSIIAFVASIGISLAMGGCGSPVELASGSTMPMKCHWTFQAVALVSVLGAVVSALVLFSKDKMAVAGLLVANAATAVVVCLLMTNFIIGVCTHSGAHCHTTRVLILVCMIVSLISSILLATLLRKSDVDVEVPNKTL